MLWRDQIHSAHKTNGGYRSKYHGAIIRTCKYAKHFAPYHQQFHQSVIFWNAGVYNCHLNSVQHSETQQHLQTHMHFPRHIVIYIFRYFYISVKVN